MCWTITLLLLQEQLSWDWQYQWYFSHWHGRCTSSLLICDHTHQPFPAQPLTCALGACHISSSAVQHAVSTVSAIRRGPERFLTIRAASTGEKPWAHPNRASARVTRTHPGFTRGSFSFLLHMSDLNHNQRRLAGLPPTKPFPSRFNLKKRLPAPISRGRRNPLGCVKPLWLPMPPTQLSLPL